jgi:hypothetical protein
MKFAQPPPVAWRPSPKLEGRKNLMPNSSKAIAFDVDAASMLSLREDFPEWEIEDVHGATADSLTDDADPGPAGLLVLGARKDVTETVGLCLALRSQAGRADTPLVVLLPPAQLASIRILLGVGANGCRVLPVRPGEVARMLATARRGNRPGQHTLNVDRPQHEDRWRDDGGQG